MPSLQIIIIWLAIAGIATMFGTVLTIRRYVVTQQHSAWMDGVVEQMTVAQCFYCDNMTVKYIGVMHDGRTYSPVCIDCQYTTGIRCPDGTIGADFIYQVEKYS